MKKKTLLHRLHFTEWQNQWIKKKQWYNNTWEIYKL